MSEPLTLEWLGFVIEQRGDVHVIAWQTGGCRPATDAEVALWALAKDCEAEHPLQDYDKHLRSDAWLERAVREIVTALASPAGGFPANHPKAIEWQRTVGASCKYSLAIARRHRDAG